MAPAASATFPRAFLAGLIAVGAFVAATFVTLLVVKIRNPEGSMFGGSGDFGGLFSLSLALVAFAIGGGGGAMAAVAGLVSGRASGSLAIAAGAGAAVGAVGHLVYAMAVMLILTLLFDGGRVWDGGLEEALWGIPSAAVIGTLAALAMAYARPAPAAAPYTPSYGSAYGSAASSGYGATPSTTVPAAPMGSTPAAGAARRVKCPRCANLITVPPGQRPSCDKCGLKA